MLSKKKKTPSTDRTAILTAESPFVYKEAYKSMRANLKYVSSACGKLKRIIITSALPNEGKSILAINLAATLADTGVRVLLIDADLRNPSMHHLLRVRVDKKIGLSAVLSGEMNVNECIFLHPQMNFYFMMSGNIPPNPNEIVGSQNMSRLLESLEDNFDYIIIDTPPVDIVSDAAVMSQFSDGVLFVVKQNDTKRGRVHSAIERLKSVNANIIGTVLNQCNMSDLNDGYEKRKDRYYYNYGYSEENRSVH